VLDGVGPEAVEDYLSWFKSGISQRRQVWETLSMTERSEFLKSRWASVTREMGKRVISGTDEFNRQVIFWPIRDMASHNLQLYRQNKITANKLFSRLKLRSLAPGEEQRLISLLKEGADRDFVKVYTVAKVTNANFAYDKFARSLIEQSPSGKLTLGLITWTRGAIEGWDRTVARPIIDGVRLKDHRRIAEGVRNFTQASAGYYLASTLMEQSLGIKGASYGRKEYALQDILQFTPLSPGLQYVLEVSGLKNTVVEETWKLVGLMEDSRKSGMSPETFMDKFGPKLADAVEVFVPLADIMPVLADKYYDKKGVTWYEILKSISPNYSPAFDSKLPRNWQTIGEKVLTSFMNTEYSDDE